jgi:hypothetical protein
MGYVSSKYGDSLCLLLGCVIGETNHLVIEWQSHNNNSGKQYEFVYLNAHNLCQ